MSEQTGKYPSDLRSPRTGIPLDTDGVLFGIEIRSKQGATAHPQVLVYSERGGGLITIPGTIDDILRPVDGEGGPAARLAEILRAAAPVEVEGYDQHGGSLYDKLAAIVRRYAVVEAAARAWLDGAAMLARQGHLQIGADPDAPSNDPAPLTDPPEFWAHLRDVLAEGRAAVETLQRQAPREAALAVAMQEAEIARKRLASALDKRPEQTFGQSLGELAAEVEQRVNSLARLATGQRPAADAEAELLAIRRVLEDWQGRTPDPARSTEQLAREVTAQADRWRIDADHYRDEAAKATDRAGLADAHGERIMQLEAELAATRADAGRWQAQLAEVEKRLHAREMEAGGGPPEKRAMDAALTVLDTLTPAPASTPHKVRAERVDWLLRVVVAADVADDVLAEVESEVNDKAGDLDGIQVVSVEREPGKPPEGWRVGNEDPQRPDTWSYGLVGAAAAEGATRSEAGAVDEAWRAYVEASSAQDKADG